MRSLTFSHNFIFLQSETCCMPDMLLNKLPNGQRKLSRSTSQKNNKVSPGDKSGVSESSKRSIKKDVAKNVRLTLNISGEMFETYNSTLCRFPETLLGDSNKRRSYYCEEKDEYFFDCNRLCFPSILFFYQSRGSLTCPMGIPFKVFETECRFFQLPEKQIEKMKREEGIIFDYDNDAENVNTVPLKQPFHITIRDVLENPESSYAGWIFGMFSISVTWLSIITATMETVPFLTTQKPGSESCSHWCVIEMLINTWFFVEFMLRLLFTRDKINFFTQPMNWVDILAVVPYFIFLILQSQQKGVMGIFKTLRFIRVVKLFRLSKHSKRLKVVGIILKSSMGDFRLLMLCLVMVIFLGGTIMYYAEENYPEDERFGSIPQSLWWSVQTITSVGYGDVIPSTLIGRGFACCFMLFGAVTISLPVLTIVSQFTELYPKNVEYDSYVESLR